MKRILTLVAITVASIGIVVLLTLNSFDRSEGISFDRDLSAFSLSLDSERKLPSNSFRFLALVNRSLYLDNKTAARLLTRVDTATLESTELILHFDGSTDLRFTAPALSADSSFVYLVDGSLPAIFETPLDSSMLSQCLIPLPAFYDFVYIGQRKAVIKTYDRVAAQDQISTIDLMNGGLQKSNILEKQLDGIFCVDGMMTYNHDQQSVIYVYFYRNEFIRADRDLCIVTKGRTIDGIDKAQISVDSWTEEAGDVRTFSTPPLKVNYRMSTSGSSLYIASNLKSNNEGEDDFQNSFAIDVYDLNTSLYKGSFRLVSPIKRRDIITFEFLVDGETLWAIFDNQLQKFTIQPR